MLTATPKLAFVDVETTGGSPESSRITEVAIVLVQWAHDGSGPPHLQRWSSLVNPHTPVPEEIRYLTGISNEMLRDAPSFEELVPTISSLLSDAVFVAHHARFDYGFIKTEMARAGIKFSARTLCTVRLSRLLNPDCRPHTLDALIIRHGLACPQRHRALGDAIVLWHFLQCMWREHGIEIVAQAATRLLQKPNLPAHLGLESVEQIPARPGIYFFHGLNAHPLYIGKSRNIRQRIGAHFCGDHRSERGLRLASETRRISWQETAGEFSALLAEIHAISEQTPAHNKALRKNSQAVAVYFNEGHPQPQFVSLDKSPDILGRENESRTLFGPFSSRAAARSRLMLMAGEHGWCLQRMGLERGHAGSPCFARQLKRCQGACTGQQSDAQLGEQIQHDLGEFQLPGWPSQRLLVVEQGQELVNWHLFERWCWLGSGNAADFEHTEHAASFRYALTAPALSADAAPESNPTGNQIIGRGGAFDRHVYALLRKHFDLTTHLGPAESASSARSAPNWQRATTRPLHARHLLFCCWVEPRQADTPIQLPDYDAALN